MEKNNDRGLQTVRASFDISTSHWKWKQLQQPSTSPSPRHLHSLVYYNNHLYLFGGFGEGEKYLDDFWQFSLAKRHWKKLKSKKPSARHSHQAVVYNNKMVLFGGISEGKTMNDLWSFDFETESWIQGLNLAVSRWGHSMVTLLDKIVIFGGADENVKVTNSLIVLDADSLQAVAVDSKDVPSARQYASMVTYDGAIYLFGGFNNKSLQDFYKLTISGRFNNTIVTQLLEVPSFVQNLRGASLSLLPYQSQLILFGGRTSQQLNDVTYSYAIGSSKWSTCASVEPSARYYHQTCVANGRIILFGGLGMKAGADKPVNLNDMWLYSDEANIAPVVNAVLDPSYIPVEIWSSILSFLEASGSSISSASVVSKQFYNIIMADDRLSAKLQTYVKSKRIYVPPIIDDTIKITIVGAGGIGKSATTIQYIMNHFIEEYDPTIEDSYIKQVTIDGKAYRLDLLDTAGPEEYSAMREHWMKTGHGVYAVYAVNDKNTIKDVDYYLDMSLRMKGAPFPLIIVGNKSDLESGRQVSKEQGQELAKKYNAPWFETSAKLNTNIEEAMLTLARSVLEADRNQQGNSAPQPAKKDRCAIS